MYSDEHKKVAIQQQQQDISKLSSFLANLGLKYTQDAIVKLWRMAGKSVDEVKEYVGETLRAVLNALAVLE